MVFRDVRLNGLTTGKKLKTFSIMTDGERRTYFGDDQATDTLLETQPYNKYSMYDLYHGHIVHNMYGVEKTNIRSTTRVKHDQNTIEDFLNICLPGFRKEDVVKAVQNGSYTYVLMAPTVSGFVYSVDGQKYQQDIDTYLYRSVVSCEAGPFPTRQQMLSCGAATAEEMFQPAFNLQNIKYNYVIEIPNEYVNGYFDDATVLGDGINTKNHLGYDYRMHITDTADAGKISPETYSRKPVAYDGIDGHVIDVVRSFTVDGNGDKTYGKYYFETEFGVYRADTLSDSQAEIVPTATIYDLSCEVKQINEDGTALVGYNIASETGVTQINCLYETPGAYMAFTDNVLSVFGLNSDGPENEIISCDNAGRIIAAFKA